MDWKNPAVIVRVAGRLSPLSLLGDPGSSERSLRSVLMAARTESGPASEILSVAHDGRTESVFTTYGPPDAFSGPGWAACFNAWCAGGVVACGVGVVRNQMP